MPKPPVEVAAGLVFRDGKLLITQRFDGAHMGGRWEFPGGKKEPGETFPECLARELAEELGISVKVGELIELIEHAYPEKTVQLHFYRCQWLRNEPRAIGCADFKWVNCEELTQYEFPPADARLLEKVRQNASWWHSA
jgi:8-oxo-dGTP diphosphatase